MLRAIVALLLVSAAVGCHVIKRKTPNGDQQCYIGGDEGCCSAEAVGTFSAVRLCYFKSNNNGFEYPSFKIDAGSYGWLQITASQYDGPTWCQGCPNTNLVSGFFNFFTSNPFHKNGYPFFGGITTMSESMHATSHLHRCMGSGCCDATGYPATDSCTAYPASGDPATLSAWAPDCMGAGCWIDDTAFGEQMKTIPSGPYASTTIQVSANRQNTMNDWYWTNAAWKGWGGPFMDEYLKLANCDSMSTQNATAIHV